MRIDPSSVLFITLDSCRYDTAAAAEIPAIARVGPVHRAQAPSHFTFASHAAMFAGFTPDIAGIEVPWLNPKFAKIFKLVGATFPGRGGEAFQLRGRNIIEGFRAIGYATIGTGAVAWFDPTTDAASALAGDFEEFFYPGSTWALGAQLHWIDEQLARHAGRPAFVFLNAGETHAPYYFAGAPWSPHDNPCVPFQKVDRAHDCRVRQRASLEFVDRALAPLLDRFAAATIVICGDHGDCWGEDGLWEHGFSHPMTLTVPLVLRVRGQAVRAPEEAAQGAAVLQREKSAT